jgi:hypothetical protein
VTAKHEGKGRLRAVAHPFEQRLAGDAVVCQVLQDFRERGGESEIAECLTAGLSVHAGMAQSLYRDIVAD